MPERRATCVVTGAHGLVGRHVLPMLARSWNVIAMVREPAPPMPYVTFHTCDLTSPEAFASLPERADAVVHLAQSRRFREFPDGAADVLAVNVVATERLARYAVSAGARHFVFASSGGVYAPSSEPLTEDAAIANPQQVGWYQASKLAAEALVHAHHAAFVPVVLRPFFIFGQGQHRDMLLPRLCDSVRDGRAITLAGRDGMRITPTHATDAARAIVAALTLTAPATINVRGPDVLSLRAIAEQLGGIVGREPVFDCRADEGASYVADERRMIDLLGAPTCAFAAHLHTILS